MNLQLLGRRLLAGHQRKKLDSYKYAVVVKPKEQKVINTKTPATLITTKHRRVEYIPEVQVSLMISKNTSLSARPLA